MTDVAHRSFEPDTTKKLAAINGTKKRLLITNGTRKDSPLLIANGK
jgi:hypothetical protein